MTDTENPSALILGAFILSRATRSHVHFFHLVFFHNLLPRVYCRNEKVMSDPLSNRSPLSRSIPGITIEKSQRRDCRRRSKIAIVTIVREKIQILFTKIFLATPRFGRNFSAPAPRRMALVYCLQLNNIT